jgi:hypothetical protein
VKTFAWVWFSQLVLGHRLRLVVVVAVGPHLNTAAVISLSRMSINSSSRMKVPEVLDEKRSLREVEHQQSYGSESELLEVFDILATRVTRVCDVEYALRKTLDFVTGSLEVCGCATLVV